MKKENVRQVRKAFNRLVTHWYDYKPLKQATDETRKQSNILFGRGKRLQKRLLTFRQAVKKNIQLVAEQQGGGGCF